MIAELEAARLAGETALGVCFGMSATVKLRDRVAFKVAVAQFQVPARLTGPAAWAVVAGEVCVAASAVAGGPVGVAGALLAVALLAAFSAAIGRQLVAGRQVVCHCFGRDGEVVAPVDLIRNGCLLAIAGSTAVLGWVAPASAPARSTVATIAADPWAATASGLVGLAVLAVVLHLREVRTLLAAGAR